MTPRSGDPGSAAERRFFLERTPEEGVPALLRCEVAHALRVLRLKAGDRLVGLDGRGSTWPLRVSEASHGRIGLVAEGPAKREPMPGDPAAPLPWIEVALAWPRGSRAEETVDRLTQLGAAAIAPILAGRLPPASRDFSGNRLERLGRIAREACKQCGRSWLPVLHPPRPLGDLVGGETVLLQPGAASGLSEWARGREHSREIGARWPWTVDNPLRIVVGPEGGFAPEEEAFLLKRSTRTARLGPHTLRIETAAEAALAILADAFSRIPRS